jgi:TRAP-type C4-dicarboxylate transport system permease small subunit
MEDQSPFHCILAAQPFQRSRKDMNAIRLIAVALIIAGALGLAFGSFSYTKETHDAKLGPIELSMKEKQTVDVPQWAGIAAIVIGGALLLFGGKKS